MFPFRRKKQEAAAQPPREQDDPREAVPPADLLSMPFDEDESIDPMDWWGEEHDYF